MHAVDSRHVESRSLTTGNVNTPHFFLFFFSPFVIVFFLSVKRQDQTKVYDLEIQLRLRDSDL